MTATVLMLANAEPARAQSDLAQLLPVDGVTVDVMEPVLPKGLEELALKLQAGLAKDPAWSQAFLSKATPGAPLPYDERLGLTKAEYDEFLALSREGRLAKVAAAPLRVERNGDATVLVFGERFRGMERIGIDLARDTVMTPAGPVSNRERIAASAQQAATGPWEGVQWTANASGEDRLRPSVSFALGRLQATGRGILYYRVRPPASVAGAVTQYVLYYDLPTPKAP